MQRKLETFAKYFLVSCILAIGLWLNFSSWIRAQWIKLDLWPETVVISFTTTPHRINNIGPTIESMLKQNAHIDKIYLSIPYEFKRDKLPYIIPKWLAENKKITILRTEDYGPATKILGVLAQVKLPPEAIIISVDDDVIYPKNLVLELAYKIKHSQNAAIGLMGANPDYDKNGMVAMGSKEGLISAHISGVKVSILQGFSGIAYKRKFFDQSIFDIVDSPKECILSDDLYISFHLAKRNIDRIIFGSKELYHGNIFWNRPIGLKSDALHKLIPGPADKHRVCIAYMKAHDPGIKF